ncbi:DNA-binding transcriptional regulator, MarR family [Micromonospora rhizosphaerae]|uniref:DNA-binding transcriptional regulator, MarR family n=1 Tax=Micromonospora rhizosphaerae TaxID=568872 RepID=A0A1C6T2E0_9ACTN|nr:MarR family transcriptional regulator [Micromonospora rhizosphaerae]SCL35938.1 DNA-binding transcriptional regulator, MarR family [Micromonospora rhizosphaerae]
MQRNSSKLRRSTGLLFDIWLVTHLTTNLLDEALRDLGVTADEFGLYSLLHELGPSTPTQIARWTGMAPTTVSGMARRLIAREHVTQMPNPRDARSRLLGLTNEGQRVTNAGGARLAATMPRLLDALAPHTSTARLGLRRLDHALRLVVGAAKRPDEPLPGETGQVADGGSVSYAGTPLNEAQQQEVQQFIRWIIHRDASPGDHG